MKLAKFMESVPGSKMGQLPTSNSYSSTLKQHTTPLPEKGERLWKMHLVPEKVVGANNRLYLFD